MDAIILAGGRGSRMMPLTADRPKSLLVAAGRPIIDNLLASLRAAGAQDVFLVAGHGHDALQGYVGDGRRHRLRVSYAVQEHPAGPVDALRHVPLDDVPEVVPVFAADGWFEDRVIAELVAAGAPAALRAVEGFSGRLGVPVVEAGRLVRVDPGRPEQVPVGLAGGFCLPRRLLEGLGGMGSLDAAIRADIGTHGPWAVVDAAGHEVNDLLHGRDLLDLNGMLMRRLEAGNQADVHPSAVITGTVRLGEGTVVGPGAVLEGPVTLGDHCEVGAGAILGPGTAARNHVHIGSGALMRDCCVASNVDVGAQSQVERAYLANGVRLGRRVLAAGDRAIVVGADAEVGAGATILDGVVGHHARVAPGRTVADVPDEGVAV